MGAHEGCDKDGCRLMKIVYKQSSGRQVQLVTVGYTGSKCDYICLDAELLEFVDDPNIDEAALPEV